MRKILFLIPLIFVNLSLIAQYSFDLHLDEDSDQIVYDIIETDNSYLLLGTDRISYGEYSTGYILEIEKDGEILQEKYFSNMNGSFIFFNIHQIDEQYFILANKVDTSSSKVDLALLILDQSLELQNEFLINMPEGYWYSHMKSIIDSDYNIVIAGYANTPNDNGNYRFDPCFYKLNLQGDSLNSNLIVAPNKNIRLIWDILERPDSNGYFTFGNYFDYIQGGELLHLSKELDSVQLNNLPMAIGRNYSVLPMSDTTFAFCGKGSYHFDAEDEIAISISDYNMNPFYYQHCRKEENMEEESSRMYGISKNDEFIYMSSISNFSSANPFFGEQPTWYHLVKMDYELNVKWEKYFGGDAYYLPYSILATEDGGCIMVGNRYDGEIQYSRDIYIVKVNSDGLIVWTQEIDLSEDKSTVLPNPGSEYLELHTGAYPATLQVHNLNGSLVLEEAIHSNISRINTLELSSGTYIWSLVEEGKVVETGKWVRE